MDMQTATFPSLRARAGRRHPMAEDHGPVGSAVDLVRLYRGIVAALPDGMPPVVQFTGAGHGAGVSTVVCDLGDAVSRAGVRAVSFDMSAEEEGLDPLIGRSKPIRVGAADRAAGFPFHDPNLDDVVFLDTAPIALSPLSMGLASSVGGTVLVVEAEASSEAEIRAALQTIAECGGRCLGLVLNKRFVARPRRRWFRRGRR